MGRSHFDVRIFNPYAPCYMTQKLDTAFKANESKKKRAYARRVINAEHGTFSPWFSRRTVGVAGRLERRYQFLRGKRPRRGVLNIRKWHHGLMQNCPFHYWDQQSCVFVVQEPSENSRWMWTTLKLTLPRVKSLEKINYRTNSSHQIYFTLAFNISQFSIQIQSCTF